uniref:Uncharacterized protein n=1 Tax=Ditylenchus dipsaci TaxID=166011 RepID=A0A915D089_9BILA
MGRLGLDVIGRVGFSLDLNTHGDNENAFLLHTRNAMDGLFYGWRASFLLFCPFFAETFETVFGVDLVENARSRSTSQRKIQRYIPTADERNFDIIHQEIYEDDTDSSNNDRNISKVELVAQSYVILVAGYEATAETLHLAIYLLALHQDIQDHVREEIFHVMGDDDEDVSPAPRINRECTQDITLNGIQLVEGDMVNIPVFALHNNPTTFHNLKNLILTDFVLKKKAKDSPTVMCRLEQVRETA